jgi:hypothetical protein
VSWKSSFTRAEPLAYAATPAKTLAAPAGRTPNQLERWPHSTSACKRPTRSHPTADLPTLIRQDLSRPFAGAVEPVCWRAARSSLERALCRAARRPRVSLGAGCRLPTE